jgi:hypothetical protein
MHISKKIRNFQRFRILNCHFNAAFVWLLKPIIFIYMPISLTIMCAFATIRFYHFLSFFELLPFPILVSNSIIVLTVCLVPAAGIYEQSAMERAEN